MLNEIVFNIWPVHEAYLQTYAFATDALKGVARGNGIEWLLDKRFRVQLFRIILATCDIKINKPGLTP